MIAALRVDLSEAVGSAEHAAGGRASAERDAVQLGNKLVGLEVELSSVRAELVRSRSPGGGPTTCFSPSNGHVLTQTGFAGCLRRPGGRARAEVGQAAGAGGSTACSCIENHSCSCKLYNTAVSAGWLRVRAVQPGLGPAADPARSPRLDDCAGERLGLGGAPALREHSSRSVLNCRGVICRSCW